MRALRGWGRKVVSGAALELWGAVLIVAGVWSLAGWGWASITAGVCLLVKAFDLAVSD